MFNEITIDAMPETIHQDAPHYSRSNAYQHVPTRDIVEWLKGDGFLPVHANEARVRKADKQGFQKHVVRFRQSENLLAEGGTFPEIVLRNSHDGTGGIQLWAGMFRLVCSNGLVVCNGSFQKISIAHRGSNLRGRILDASHSVISVASKAGTAIREWSKIELTGDQRVEFARKALELRFGDIAESPINPEQALLIRRSDDHGADLWRTFNVVQENMIRGGILGSNRRNENGARLYRTLRGIRGAQRNIDLNAGLWSIADEFAQAA